VGGAVGAGIGAMIGAAWGWVTAPVTALRTLSPFASYLADARLTAMGWEPMQQIVSAMGHDPNANVTQTAFQAAKAQWEDLVDQGVKTPNLKGAALREAAALG